MAVEQALGGIDIDMVCLRSLKIALCCSPFVIGTLHEEEKTIGDIANEVHSINEALENDRVVSDRNSLLLAVAKDGGQVGSRDLVRELGEVTLDAELAGDASQQSGGVSVGGHVLALAEERRDVGGHGRAGRGTGRGARGGRGAGRRRRRRRGRGRGLGALAVTTRATTRVAAEVLASDFGSANNVFDLAFVVVLEHVDVVDLVVVSDDGGSGSGDAGEDDDGEVLHGEGWVVKVKCKRVVVCSVKTK